MGAGCGGRDGVVMCFVRVDERRDRGRRSRVVLTPRRWRQVGEDGRSFSWHRAGDGDKKARSPRRARRKPLKPLRRKCRDVSGGPVVTNARAFYTTRAAAGASSARHFLRPQYFGRTNFARLGRMLSREREAVFFLTLPLRGEGRLRSRRGGVKPHNEAIVIRKTSPPTPPHISLRFM